MRFFDFVREIHWPKRFIRRLAGECRDREERTPPRFARRKTRQLALVILMTSVTIAAILPRGGDTLRCRLSRRLCRVRKNPWVALLNLIADRPRVATSQ